MVGAVQAQLSGGLARWPVATLLALWPAFGGHWVDLWFLNWRQSRLDQLKTRWNPRLRGRRKPCADCPPAIFRPTFRIQATTGTTTPAPAIPVPNPVSGGRRPNRTYPELSPTARAVNRCRAPEGKRRFRSAAHTAATTQENVRRPLGGPLPGDAKR